jgi:hypothetical protein
MAVRRAPHGAGIALLMACVASICSCGGAEARGATTAPPPQAALGPLAPLVPPGARLVIAARPAELFASGAASRIVDVLVVPGGLDRFAAHTGVDPRRLSEAVYAEYDDGASLVLIRGPIDAEFVVREAGERMSAVESRADVPLVRRAGLLSNERRELVALEHDVVAVTGGPAVPHLAALLSCVTSSPRRCRSAFGGSDAGALLLEHRAAPLALFAPTGLTLPEGFGTASLLAGTRALVAAVSPLEPAELAVVLELRGRFPEDAEANFRALLLSVGASDLGAMMGLRAAAERVVTERTATGMKLRTTLEVATITRGLQVLFAGEIREILDPPSASPRPASEGGADAGASI